MQLPLFPLNTVLFPGMPIRLHIFEARYKEMINECIDNRSPFGVVLIEEGIPELGPLAKPRLIGTSAYITQVQRILDGRMNILAIGRDRFRIKHIDTTSRSFLVGEVDLLPLASTSNTALQVGMKHFRPLLERYLDALSQAGQVEFDMNQLPDDPLAIAFLGAVLLQADKERKQSLLEASDARDLFEQLLRIYNTEVALIDVLLSPPEVDNRTPFSFN